MEEVFILIALGLFFLYISLKKKDSTLLFFSGASLVFGGLGLFNDYGDLGNSYFGFSMVIVFVGLYIMIRTGLEMILDRPRKNRLEYNEDPEKNKIKINIRRK